MTLTPTDLKIVNTKVNARTNYTGDPAKYGVPEFWEVAEEDGDCEDYGLAKIQLLKRMGMPIAQMRLATCFVRPWSSREEKAKKGHAVTIVRINGVDYCLDNCFPLPMEVSLLNYEWHKFQIPGTREWEWAPNADRSFE